MFDHAFTFVLDREGGYVDHPLDKGGATNMGITQRSYNAWRSSQTLPIKAVKEITVDEVEQIYRQSYWINGRCDDIAWTHPDTATVHFDACVNHGLNRAARMLQEAIGTVKVDGIIGPKTMGALLDMSDANIAQNYIGHRYHFYHRIVRSNPSQLVFLRGWIARIRHLAASVNVPWQW